MKNSEEPAFPVTYEIIEKCGDKPNPFGLTKREYFAAMAMQGLLAQAANEVPKEGTMHVWNYEAIAKYAVKAADELLKQLDNEQKEV